MRTISFFKALCLLCLFCAFTFNALCAKRYVSASGSVLGAPTTTFGYTYCPSPMFAGGSVFSSSYDVCQTSSTGTSTTTYTPTWKLTNSGGTTLYDATGTTFVVTGSTATSTFSTTLDASLLSSSLSMAGTYYLTVKYTASATSPPASGCTPISTGTTGVTTAICTLTIVDPTVTVAPLTSDYCASSGAVSLTATAASGATFSWTAPTGCSISGSGATVTMSPSVSGVYTVTSTLTPSVGSCSASASATVYAPTPYTVTPSGAGTVCIGSGTTLSPGISAGSDFSSESTETAASLEAIGTSVLLNLVDESGMSDYDNGFYTVPLGFNFNFYGVTYNSITISANGYANFGAPTSEVSELSLPNTGSPGACVALFAQDLNPGASYGYGDMGYTVTGTSGSYQFYIIYNNIMNEAGTASFSGQIMINQADNTIHMMIEPGTYSATQGVQNLDGTNGYEITGRDLVTSTSTPYVIAANEQTVFNFTGTASTYTYLWSVGSGPGGLSGTTVASPTGTSISAATTYDLTTTDHFGCSSSGSVTITPLPYNWEGTTSTDWNTASNWQCGSVPTITNDASVPSGAPNYPVLMAAGAVNNLTEDGGSSTITINSGNTLTVGANLTITHSANISMGSSAVLQVAGNVENEGTITGAGTMVLNGTTAQTLKSTGTAASMKTISNLNLKNTSDTIIIDSTGYDSVGVTTALTFDTTTHDTLYTNNSLVLLSSAAGTARVGVVPSTSTIIGEVTAQQYIPPYHMAWRFLGHPFTGNLVNGLQQIIVSGVDINGAGGTADCFINSNINIATAFYYTHSTSNSMLAYDTGWQPYTSGCGAGTGNNFGRYQGIRVLIKGAPGQGYYMTTSYTMASGHTYSPLATTFEMTGNLNIGEQDVPLLSDTNTNVSNYTNFSIPSVGYRDYSQTYNLLSNPYPSPINLSAVLARNYIGADTQYSHDSSTASLLYAPFFWVYQPKMGVEGQYLPQYFIGTNYDIPANTMFEVRANPNYTGGSGSPLKFYESDKVASTTYTDTNSLFRVKPEFTVLNIMGPGDNLWDVVNLQFNNAATANEDRSFDAGKRMGFDFNFFTISQDNHPLSYDFRPFAEGQAIPLGMNGKTPAPLTIEVQSVAVPAGEALYLHDKVLGVYQLLQPGMEYPFDYKADAAMQGDRFELQMRSSTAIETVNSSLPFTASLSPNPAKDAAIISISGGSATENTIARMLDITGSLLKTQNAGIFPNGNFSLDMKSFPAGVYLVEITSGNNKVIQRLVKE